MPANTGRKPPHELVDIQLRNGWIIRCVESAKFRWKPWPDGESLGDIVRWQKATGTDYRFEIGSETGSRKSERNWNKS